MFSDYNNRLVIPLFLFCNLTLVIMDSLFEEVKQLTEAIENITKLDDIKEVIDIYKKIPDSNSQFRLNQLYRIVVTAIVREESDKRKIIDTLHNEFSALYEGYGFMNYHGPYCYIYPGKSIISIESPDGSVVNYKETTYVERIKEKSYISVISNNKCIFKCYVGKSRTLNLKLNIRIYDHMTQIIFKNGNDAIYKLCYRDTTNTKIRDLYNIECDYSDHDYMKIICSDNLESLKEYAANPNFDINEEHYYPCISHGIYDKKRTLIELAVNYGAINCFKYLFSLGADIRPTIICYHMMVGGNLEIFRILERTINIKDNLNTLYTFAIKYHRNDIFKYLYEKYGISEFDLSNLIYYTFVEYNYGIIEYMKNNNVIKNILHIEEAYDRLIERETSKEAYHYLIH